jgi:hypothetical protein
VETETVASDDLRDVIEAPTITPPTLIAETPRSSNSRRVIRAASWEC